MRFAFGSRLALLTVLGIMSNGHPGLAQPVQFDQAEISDPSKIILMAGPIGTTGAYKLLVFEQLNDRRLCWQELGKNPTMVDPLFMTFDFTGICARGTDSNSYSIRLAGQDYGGRYNLRIARKNNELVLIGYSLVDKNVEFFEIGRTHGLAEGFHKIELDPGWRLTKRSFQGKLVGHIYLTNDQPLAAFAKKAVPLPQSTPDSVSAPSTSPPFTAPASTAPVSPDAPSQTTPAPPTQPELQAPTNTPPPPAAPSFPAGTVPQVDAPKVPDSKLPPPPPQSPPPAVDQTAPSNFSQPSGLPQPGEPPASAPTNPAPTNSAPGSVVVPSLPLDAPPPAPPASAPKELSQGNHSQGNHSFRSQKLKSVIFPDRSITPFQATSFNLPAIANASIGRGYALWATYYYTHRAENVASGYPLLDMTGNSLGATLSNQDWCASALEGSVQVVRGAQILGVYNYAGRGETPQVDCAPYYPQLKTLADTNRVRFKQSNTAFGEGVNGYALVPYRTVAVDRNLIPIGSVVYIPAARGTVVVLPSGARVVHDGYFYAADGGKAITGNHIDVFLGIADRNPFSFVKSTESGTFTAYLVNNSAIKARLTAEHQASKFTAQSSGLSRLF